MRFHLLWSVHATFVPEDLYNGLVPLDNDNETSAYGVVHGKLLPKVVPPRMCTDKETKTTMAQCGIQRKFMDTNEKTPLRDPI